MVGMAARRGSGMQAYSLPVGTDQQAFQPAEF
jgi:hypothetical protein